MTFFLFPELHTRGKRTIMRFFIRRAVKYAEALIFASQSSQRDTERILPISDNLRCVAPLGVSSHQVIEQNISSGRLPSALSGVANYLLFVGTIEPRKNILRIIQAFECLARKYPDLQLVVAGKLGWHTDEIVAGMRDSPVSARIHSLGFDVALRAEIVDFVRLYLPNHVHEAERIREITVMEHEPSVARVRVLVEMVDAISVEQRTPPLDAMDCVALPKQQLSQIGPILARDSCSQSILGQNDPLQVIFRT